MCPELLEQHALGSEPSYPPINYFYSHFHSCIKAELDVLSSGVRTLESTPGAELQLKLQDLREHYRFLEQIYKYHSSVEDEVGQAARTGPGQGSNPGWQRGWG